MLHSPQVLTHLMEKKAAEKNWTKPQLLHHFGISHANFSRMKAGIQNVKVDTYVRLCLKLKLNLETSKQLPIKEEFELKRVNAVKGKEKESAKSAGKK
jgi:DNA-binding Xre family transcriptional regulator